MAHPPSALMTAYGNVVQAIRDLATSRGHRLGRAIEETRFQIALQCSVCDGWLCIALEPGDAPSITGKALVPCRGKRYGPLSNSDTRQAIV